MTMRIDRPAPSTRVTVAILPASPPSPAPAPGDHPATPPAAIATTAPPPAGGQPVTAPASSPQDAATHDEFMDAARQLRQAISVTRQTDLHFNVNPDTNAVQVEIVNRETGEVIRQIPHEMLMRFAEAFDAYLGTLLDIEA